ncbi:hypothetical protein CDAR_264921 [Caerostris darwini]|uniref:Uncharacterized protein n=1 Tax=Caerostris darwini TaxID=1538125 RepID=A0AAV4SGK0_9ARAC|nr:hypothetical protein CDAR_264921 [Caerostris darwini]
MTISASMVAEASSEVHLKSLLTPEIAENSTLAYQRLIMYAEKEIFLTAWGIMPMKKKFIFGMLGMSLTYTLLFYGSAIDSFVIKNIVGSSVASFDFVAIYRKVNFAYQTHTIYAEKRISLIV